MLRFILLSILVIAVLRLVSRLIGGVIEGARGATFRQPAAAVKLVRDPVCGTFVTPRPSLSLTAGGSTYYFCSEECRGKFSVGSRQQ